MTNIGRTLRRVWRWLKRLFRAAVLVIRDQRVPKPLRVVMALGCFVPIPGPFDEMFAALMLGIVWVFWRSVLVEAWENAR